MSQTFEKFAEWASSPLHQRFKEAREALFNLEKELCPRHDFEFGACSTVEMQDRRAVFALRIQLGNLEDNVRNRKQAQGEQP